MNMMNMQAKEINYRMESEERLVKRLINSFRKYWEENSDMIIAGLGTLNGNVPFRYFYNK